MKNKKKVTVNIIKAHEATGHTTMQEHMAKVHRAVQKAVSDDPRFNKPPATPGGYQCKPYVCDITTPDDKGQQHAIINTTEGKLVRHAFDVDDDEGTAKLVEGDSTPTERTTVYAREIDRHENMVKASLETISCRASSGVKITASEPWEPGKSVSYIYVPGGVTTISAGFRKNESITCTVQVDEETAKDLQDSFDFIAATEKQEPYADEDHESKKATLRFPPSKVNFTYGTHRGEEGVIVTGAEPTSYGAEAVNGKVYASWSPEFATDADYSKAKSKKGHWTFPDGVRGSESNPARLVAVNFVTGALTNKPAFRNMPPVKAKKVELDANGEPVEPDVIAAAGTSEGVKKGWENRARLSKIAYDAGTEAHMSEHKLGLVRRTDEESPDYINKIHEVIGYHNKAASLHEVAEKSYRETKEKSDTHFADNHKEERERHSGYAKSLVERYGRPGDTKATSAATAMDTIYARQASNAEAMSKLEARVPATATRAALESLYARVGANDQR